MAARDNCRRSAARRPAHLQAVHAARVKGEEGERREGVQAPPHRPQLHQRVPAAAAGALEFDGAQAPRLRQWRQRLGTEQRLLPAAQLQRLQPRQLRQCRHGPPGQRVPTAVQGQAPQPGQPRGQAADEVGTERFEEGLQAQLRQLRQLQDRRQHASRQREATQGEAATGGKGRAARGRLARWCAARCGHCCLAVTLQAATAAAATTRTSAAVQLHTRTSAACPACPAGRAGGGRCRRPPPSCPAAPAGSGR